MKIALIHPPDHPLSIAPGRFEPLALEVLAATVPEHEVKIIDMRLDKYLTLDRILHSFEPHLVGITVNNTIHVNQASRLLGWIRNRYPEILLAIGGHHPTMMSRDFHLKSVDFIFLGWAEKSFPEFIHCLEERKSLDHIHGLEILSDGHVISRRENQWDLRPSEIPFPRHDLVDRYRKHYTSDLGYKTALVNTTRGCANRCYFCCVWKATSGKFLVRNAEDVFAEIAAIPNTVNHVFFADDNTFLRTENTARLAQMISEAGIKKKYSGYCRSDTIAKHPELMQQWKDIGLNNLCVGMEATDDSELDRFNKKNEIASNEEAARILNKIGIPFRPHFLIEPGFVEDDFRRIAAYVRKNRLDSPIFPILTPIPGSDYYEDVSPDINNDYPYFDYAHPLTPTRLSLKEFYRNWVQLFLGTYSLTRNLKHAIIKSIAKLRGNKQLAQQHHHCDLLNVIKLKLLYIPLRIKLSRFIHLQMMRKVSP